MLLILPLGQPWSGSTDDFINLIVTSQEDQATSRPELLKSDAKFNSSPTLDVKALPDLESFFVAFEQRLLEQGTILSGSTERLPAYSAFVESMLPAPPKVTHTSVPGVDQATRQMFAVRLIVGDPLVLDPFYALCRNHEYRRVMARAQGSRPDADLTLAQEADVIRERVEHAVNAALDAGLPDSLTFLPNYAGYLEVLFGSSGYALAGSLADLARSRGSG